MKTILVIFLFLTTYAAFTQTTFGDSKQDLEIDLEMFEQDFKAAIQQDFDFSSIQRLQALNYRLFEPSGFDEETGYNYYLSNFLNKPYYIQAIERLFNSTNPQQKNFAYSLIAGTGDKKYESRLLNELKEGQSADASSAILTLLALGTKETTILFDALFEQEFDGQGLWMVGLMMTGLDKDALRATAYQKIESEDIKKKTFATYLLSYTGQNEKTNALLLDAVETWDEEAKVAAIYALKELRVGNLLETLEPLLANPNLNRAVLDALASSPTKEDLDYLKQKAASQETISRELLSAFCFSTNPDAVRYWFELLYTKDAAQWNRFSAKRQALLISDDFLPEVQKAVVKVEDPRLFRELLALLKGRTDDVSTQILLDLLKREDKKIEGDIISALMENNSPEVEKAMILRFKDSKNVERQVVNWLIQHEVDTLHRTFERIYAQKEQNVIYNNIAFSYLAHFPKTSYLELFKNILEDANADSGSKRLAIMGIERLKDKKTIDFLIKKCSEEENSQLTYQYLKAVSWNKIPKVKALMSRYKDSEQAATRKLVFEFLRDW